MQSFKDDFSTILGDRDEPTAKSSSSLCGKNVTAVSYRIWPASESAISITKRTEGVTATIHTRYSEQFLTDLKKHNEQYPTIEYIQLPHRHHDRFLIIDDKVHSLGASLKDMGAGMCAVIEMMVAPETILELLK